MNPSFIPVADPLAGYHAHQNEIDQALAEALQGGRYILGPQVKVFEQAFASFLGLEHCIGVNSGTDALVLAIRALDLQEGDEVITVSHSAVATVAAIELAGATPVLVDIDSQSHCMSPQALEEAIGTRTRAVIPVHLYGHPADMPAIMPIARAHGLRVIEDCAQAHGATINGQMVGTFGDIACFSFYPTKNLGALGDGGAVATARQDLAERVRFLREYGWKDRYVSSLSGMNSRLDEIQAAILNVKLKYLQQENQERRKLAEIYRRELSSTSLCLPSVQASCEHVYHLYVIETQERDRLQTALLSQVTGTAIHYPMAIHQQPAYQGRLRGCTKLPNTEALIPRILSLPMYPQMSAEQAERVCEALLTCLKP